MGKAEASGPRIARGENSSSCWHQRSFLPRPTAAGQRQEVNDEGWQAGEMAKSEKCLPCKHKALSSDLQRPCKKPGSLSREEVEIGASPGPCWPGKSGW